MTELLSEEEIEEQISGLEDWMREGEAIKREFSLDDFISSMEFVNFIAEKAEELDHHPDIDIRYDKVTIFLSTHSAGGLTEKDFELAKEIQKLYDDFKNV